MHNYFYKFVILSLVTCLAHINYCSADATIPNLNKGLKIQESHEPYWFAFNGNIRFDETVFIGNTYNKQTDFPSGALLKTAEATFTGGFHNDLTYRVTVGAKPGSKLQLGDAFIAYTGLSKNSYIAAGQIAPCFSLESTNSGKWHAFLDRTLAHATLSPHSGLGVTGRVWNSSWVLSASLLQRDHFVGYHSSRLAGSTRLVYAPFHSNNKVLQFGVSTAYQSVETRNRDGSDRKALSFGTLPEAKARKTAQLVKIAPIQARGYQIHGIEASMQRGPLHAKAEYINTIIHRSPSKLKFKGWDVLARYVLTGEAQAYSFGTGGGTFGQVKPQSPNGAWEIATRYSVINLNDKDIRGGYQRNLGFSLSWYANNNVRFLINYLKANIHPHDDMPKRTIGILGSRVQVVW